ASCQGPSGPASLPGVRRLRAATGSPVRLTLGWRWSAEDQARRVAVTTTAIILRARDGPAEKPRSAERTRRAPTWGALSFGSFSLLRASCPPPFGPAFGGSNSFQTNLWASKENERPAGKRTINGNRESGLERRHWSAGILPAWPRQWP